MAPDMVREFSSTVGGSKTLKDIGKEDMTRGEDRHEQGWKGMWGNCGRYVKRMKGVTH